MPITKDFLDAVAATSEHTSASFILPWPAEGNPCAFLSFASFAEWRDFILRMTLHPAVPTVVSLKFERAQKLYLLAWTDADLIKAGELVALAGLELALKDRYWQKVKVRHKDKNSDRPIRFAELLRYMVDHDELTDEKLPMVQLNGGAVVDSLTGRRKPSLADIRNGLAHGDPFDGLPWAGLLELVKELIEYAYRDVIDESSQRMKTVV